jgi:SAM-dependent methyltransferase
VARHRDEPAPAPSRRLVERIADVALTAMPVPVRLLDADCGGGELLRELLARIPNCEAYTGVDAAPVGIRAARLASEPRMTLACAAPEALPFPNNHFDLVLSGASFDRWRDQRRGVAELARVVRDNGTVVLIDLAGPLRLRQPGRYRTRTELTKLLTDAGLHVPGGSVHRLGTLARSGHAFVATR